MSDKFTLSAKVVKKMTREELGYELSSNSFDLLNEKAREYLIKGFEVEEVNEWIIKILNKFKETKIVRRCDIEAAIKQEEPKEPEERREEEEVVETDETNNPSSSDDHVSVRDIDIVQLPSQVDMIRELEEEIERLKKIIQIILNKQAELV